ncbi:MAG TPA: anti-sigma factor [Bacteroidia bacterium]|nr:anti-sigma factor [Bacteroidia bacterium]
MVEEKYKNGTGNLKVIVSRWSKAYKILLAACLFAMLIGTATSVFFFMKWYQAEQHYAKVRNENSRTKQELEFLKLDFQSMFNEQSIIRDINCQVVNLKDPKGESTNYARIYWNRFSGEVFLDVIFLPVPPSGKEYHLWVYDMGLPADLGHFKMNFDKHLQRMVSVIVADSWAVSLEPDSAVTMPTKETILLRSAL